MATDEITITDVDDRERCYSYRVPSAVLHEFGYHDVVCQAISRLILAAQQDAYWLREFRTTFLSEWGSLTVSGIGFNAIVALKELVEFQRQLNKQEGVTNNDLR